MWGVGLMLLECSVVVGAVFWILYVAIEWLVAACWVVQSRLGDYGDEYFDYGDYELDCDH